MDNGFYLNHCTRALAVRTDIPHTSLTMSGLLYAHPEFIEGFAPFKSLKERSRFQKFQLFQVFQTFSPKRGA